MLFAQRYSPDSRTRFVCWLLVFVLGWHSALFPTLAASHTGDNTTFDYDVRGCLTLKRPAQRLLDAGDVAVTMSYTGENLKVVKRGTLETAYVSDANRGWLSAVSGPKGTINYGYDVSGLRTSVSAAGGITAYSYDELGRMKTVSDKPTGTSAFKLLATYSYDAVGNLQSTVTSNGASAPLATTRYSYDDLNRLGSMSHRRGLAETGAVVSGYDYTVRADGKRTALAETVTGGDGRVSNRNVGFSYDDAGCLTGENGKDGEGVAYRLNWKLDDVGNRTLETRLRAKDAASTDFAGGTLSRTVSNYSASGTDWLTRTSTSRGATNAAGTDFTAATTDTATSYGYDSNGAQTRKTTGENSEGFEWDFEGHLTRVEKGDNNATRFTYDASGNRIQTLVRDGAKLAAINFLVDENTQFAQVLEERDAAGTLGARYVYGQGFGPLWMQRVQKNAAGVEEVRTRFLLADGHGSIRQLMDEAGAVTDSYFYDAFGSSLAGGSGNTVNPYRYNGQQTDAATGGYYLRARYYQPGTGRFLSHDPLFGHDDDPVSLHRYLYAAGDGVNLSDPSGKMTATETSIAVGLVSILIAAYYRHSSDISYYNYGIVMNVRPFTTEQQTIVDDLRVILNRNSDLKSICSPLDNLEGVDYLPNANAETRPLLGRPGYAIVLGDRFFDEKATQEKRLTVLIHECLHVYVGLESTRNSPNNGPHRRLSGWAKNLAQQTKNEYVIVPDNLRQVIINDAKPTPDQDYGDHTAYYGDDIEEPEQD